MSTIRRSFLISIQLFIATILFGQDLDPRSYVWVPIKATTLVTGYSYSFGGVVTDATLPIQDIEAKVHATSIGLAHSFKFFNLTSQAMVAIPYSFANVSGNIDEQRNEIDRNGFADLRVRWSVLLVGGPASSLQQIKKSPRKTIVGMSLNVIIPTGQYFSDKLINLGTNRVSIRPEAAISKPFGKKWLIDFYSGVWIFTTNNSFYPDNSKRSQNPMATFQAHLSYNIKPLFWVALNATYYLGGSTFIDDVKKDDRQENSRIGATFVMPVGKRNSLKLSVSKGAIIRLGQNFTTISIGWQTTWLGKSKSTIVPENEL